jgi:hypothetical protein
MGIPDTPIITATLAPKKAKIPANPFVAKEALEFLWI